jgi:hypothetical protein
MQNPFQTPISPNGFGGILDGKRFCESISQEQKVIIKATTKCLDFGS